MAQPGGVPIDRYVVLEHLSEGGMGAIYVGKKMGAGGFEMEVVLKQLLPEFTQQEEFIDLFLREAKLSATLDHANIVHTIDLVTAGGEYFIVMEYLPGGDLRTLLKKAKRRGKRFSPAAAIYISREVLSALSYAHAKRDFDGKPLKLIHRDVSPSNILLSQAGEVKLTDFGIAKAATHTSLFYKVKGKIGYMSPEQAKSEPLDSRSDLYSLAVCMYEILTGERLFVAAGITTSADEIYSQPVPQISKKVPGLPADLDAVMAKALALSPDQRYQTAGEFQEALMRCAHRNGLLMSAPELASELRDTCGDPDTWRTDEEDAAGEAPRAGTEVYDPSSDGEDDGDGDDDDVDDADDDDLPVPALPMRRPAARAASPAPKSPVIGIPPRPKTEVDRFAGVELTSIINMMALDDHGSKPLVDLDAGPVLSPSSPRNIDSDPGLATFVSGLSDNPLGPASSPPPVVSPAPSRPANTGERTRLPPSTGERPRLPPSTGERPRLPPHTGERALSPPVLAASEALPTHRRMPTADPALSPRPAEPTAVTARRNAPRFVVQPWMVVVLLVLVFGIVALVVALSGPSVPAGR